MSTINNLRKNKFVFFIEAFIRVIMNKFIRLVCGLRKIFKNHEPPSSVYGIILNGGIGDCIMAVPAIHQLSKVAEAIYLIVPSHSKIFFETYENIHVCEYEGSHRKLEQFYRWVLFLRQRKMTILSFNPRFEFFLVSLLSPHSRYFGFIQDRITLSGYGLSFDDVDVSGMNKMTRYRTLVEHLDFSVSSEAFDWAFYFKSKYSCAMFKTDYVVCAPGKTNLWPAGRWAPERFSKSIEKVANKYGLTVIFVGTSDQSFDVATVIEKLDGKTSFIDLCGRTNMKELISVIIGARAVLCNDSGIMHLANLVEVPCISIFSFSCPNEFSWGDKAIPIHAKKLPCQPCVPSVGSLIGDNFAFHCPYNSACDRSVKSVAVIEAFERIFNDGEI